MTKGTVGEDTTTDSPAYKVLEKPPSNWGDFKIQNLSFSLFRAIDRPVTWFRGLSSKLKIQIKSFKVKNLKKCQ